MDEDILTILLLFVSGMAMLGCVTGVIMTIIKRRPSRVSEGELGHRLEEISDRLGRLDGAIDAMAVEVERISEAQRFTARVLAERAPAPSTAPAIPERSRAESVTPH